MRGEFCIAGASIFSFVSVVLMVFTIIGQINPTTLPKGIYMAQVDVAAYGAGLQSATNTSVGGLYMTNATSPLGQATGLRQQYRWALLGSCAYVKTGDGLCNSTTFGNEFEPLAVILSDTPSKFKVQTNDIIPTEASGFRNNTSNGTMSRAAFWTIFIGACAAAVALIVGVIPSRLTFLVSALASTIATLGLLIGAAIWTSLIAKDNFINKVHVSGGKSLGITLTAGPGLYMTWVAMAFSALSIAPYIISCCTYRR